MSRRPGRWDLVDQSTDPVPTDDRDVAALARGFEATVHDIALLAGRLDRLSRLDGWRGEAAETFAVTAEDGAHELRKAQTRYDRLAAAVRAWVEPVQRARQETAAGLRRAEAAEQERLQHRHDLTAGVPDPSPALQEQERRRQERYDAAVAALHRAAADVAAALDDLDVAARRTAGAIHDAADAWKDGRWADFTGWVRDHAHVIAVVVDVLSYAAVAVALAAVAISLFVTVPFALVALGTALSLGLLLGHAALLAAGTGQASWLDVGMDLLGLATFGLSALASKGVAGVAEAYLGHAAAYRSEQTYRAVLSAAERSPNGVRAANATRITDSTNPLYRWGTQQQAAALAEARAAASRAADEVLAIATLEPTKLQVLLVLDRELAQQLAQVAAARELLGTSLPHAGIEELAGLLEAARLPVFADQAVALGGPALDLSGLQSRLEQRLGDVAARLSRWQWRLTTAGR